MEDVLDFRQFEISSTKKQLFGVNTQIVLCWNHFTKIIDHLGSLSEGSENEMYFMRTLNISRKNTVNHAALDKYECELTAGNAGPETAVANIHMLLENLSQSIVKP